MKTRYYQVKRQQHDPARLADTLSRMLHEELGQNRVNCVVVSALDGAIPIAVKSTEMVKQQIGAEITKVRTSTKTVPSRVTNNPKDCYKIEITLQKTI